MGSSPSLPAWEIRDLTDSTGFSSEQIEILHRRFLHLTDGKTTMCKSCFDNIPDLECNPIKSRIVNAFFDTRNLGQQSNGSVEDITFENFLTTLSFFQHMDDNHTKEDLEYGKNEKLKWKGSLFSASFLHLYEPRTSSASEAPTSTQNIRPRRTFITILFHMYDTNGDGKITLEELREIIDELLSKTSTTEKTSSSIADAAMLEAATICEGQVEPDQLYEGINFEDFLKIMQDIKIESKMHVRFLNMDTTAICK